MATCNNMLLFHVPQIPNMGAEKITKGWHNRERVS
jgi:hypothetical protein